MESTVEDKASIEIALAKIQVLQVGHTEELAGVLRDESLEGRAASSKALLDWAKALGAARAVEGKPVGVAVAQATEVAQILGAVPAGRESGEKLAVQLVTATVQGYMDAHTTEARGGEIELRLAELTALHRINSAANSSLNLSDMLRETAAAVVAVTHADVCSVFLYEPEWDNLVLTATSGLSQGAVDQVRLRIGEGIAGWAAMVGKPIALSNAWGDSRFKYIPQLHEEGVVSMLAVPVVLFTKEKLVGVIAINNFEEREFSEDEIKFLETVAGEIAIAIENARLYEQTDTRLRQKVAELSTLQGVSAHIAATLNLSEVLNLIAYQAAHLVHADGATIYELQSDGAALELVSQYDLQDPNHNIHQGKSAPHVTMSAGSSGISAAILHGIPAQLPPDTDAELGVPFARGHYRSMFCVPLVAPRGIMGGICLYNLEPTTFTDEQVRLLDAFGHEAAIALENSRLYDAALRGLMTKSAMLQEMNHRVRNNLQTVAGLLSMQLRRLPREGEAATAVRESIGRIQSMAAVHDLMVRGGSDVQSTTLYELARKVTEAAISTLLTPGFKLNMKIEPVEAEQIRVNSHEATLLALLLNELASNAILHGFQGRDSGEITVRAWSAEGRPSAEGGEPSQAHNVTLEVRDNGSGLPQDFDPLTDANLGLNIVRTLVTSDLRGTFSIRPAAGREGTVARITFVPDNS